MYSSMEFDLYRNINNEMQDEYMYLNCEELSHSQADGWYLEVEYDCDGVLRLNGLLAGSGEYFHQFKMSRTSASG